jgi:hypothetical protein
MPEKVIRQADINIAVNDEAACVSRAPVARCENEFSDICYS